MSESTRTEAFKVVQRALSAGNTTGAAIAALALVGVDLVDELAKARKVRQELAKAIRDAKQDPTAAPTRPKAG